ncbi:hypothetical protein [Paraburkholderia dipogonis]|uniref:hypothetical protein n=1 Tax=Paraburkholderia dipogonis TaxID=1211383 RepID=UPI0038BA9C6D
MNSVLTVTPITAYVSDLNIQPWKIEPKAFSGAFSDTDIALSFTDDGRLSGINLTATGQGSTVVQDLVAIAKVVAPFVASAPPQTAPNTQKACSVIADFAGKGAAKAGLKGQGGKGDPGNAPAADSTPASVVLSYSARVEFGKTPPGAAHADANTMSIGMVLLDSDSDQRAEGIAIKPDLGSSPVYNALINYLPNLPFELDIKESRKIVAGTWENASSTDIPIKLNSVAAVTIQVKGATGDWKDRGVVWNGQVPVPLTSKDDLYDLPIPKAAAFGTMKFSLVLSNYGSIEKLGYSTTGASDAANSANTLAGGIAAILKKPTTSDEASSIQAQSDLIYQQQRLIICQATPKSCQGK